jgi:hypothetical protein
MKNNLIKSLDFFIVIGHNVRSEQNVRISCPENFPPVLIKRWLERGNMRETTRQTQ